MPKKFTKNFLASEVLKYLAENKLMSLTKRNENKIERKRKSNIFIFLWIISATAAVNPVRKINWTAPNTINVSKVGI